MWHCTKCDILSEVIDSRRKDGYIFRRRKCPKCNKRWSTVEIHTDEYDHLQEQNRLLTQILMAVKYIADGM